MAAGLRAYGAVLADPRARAFSAAGFVARMPLSMTGIGIVLLVSLTTGSFGRAGLIAAVLTLIGAASAPLWGRLIDRVGQATVLVTAAAVNSLSLSLLITSVLQGWALAISLLAAAGVGAGFSSAGGCVRARWSVRLGEGPLLNTAFALEAVIDEVVFIVGPVLATFLCTSFHPALGLAVSGVIGLGGAFALAVQRSTQPPVRGQSRSTKPADPLPIRLLISVAVACFALGMVFGGMEVVVVGFAKAAGVLPYAGVILMAWAFGSLLAGVITGGIAWQSPPAQRFRLGALALGLTLLPLPFVSNPVVVGAVLVISGFAIAPTLIASVAVVQAAAPASRLTESLGWSSTGLAAGVAAGAALLGQLIDSYGAGKAFWGVVAAGGLLMVAALFVRGDPARTATIDPELTDSEQDHPPRRPEQTPLR